MRPLHLRHKLFGFFTRLMRRRVACETCPSWIRQGEVPPVVLEERVIRRCQGIGVCAFAKPEFFSYGAHGYGFRAMLAADWCAKHPCFRPELFIDSNLEYTPHADSDGVAMNRAPTFDELVGLSHRIGMSDEDIVKALETPDETVILNPGSNADTMKKE